MVSNTKLFSVGNFDFRLQHLLIIGILAIAVSTSALLRAQPASYGFALNEFDPFLTIVLQNLLLIMDMKHILNGMMTNLGILMEETFLKLHK